MKAIFCDIFRFFKAKKFCRAHFFLVFHGNYQFLRSLFEFSRFVNFVLQQPKFDFSYILPVKFSENGTERKLLLVSFCSMALFFSTDNSNGLNGIFVHFFTDKKCFHISGRKYHKFNQHPSNKILKFTLNCCNIFLNQFYFCVLLIQ